LGQCQTKLGKQEYLLCIRVDCALKVVSPGAFVEGEDVEHWTHKEENKDDREELWNLVFVQAIADCVDIARLTRTPPQECLF